MGGRGRAEEAEGVFFDISGKRTQKRIFSKRFEGNDEVFYETGGDGERAGAVLLVEGHKSRAPRRGEGEERGEQKRVDPEGTTEGGAVAIIALLFSTLSPFGWEGERDGEIRVEALFLTLSRREGNREPIAANKLVKRLQTEERDRNREREGCIIIIVVQAATMHKPSSSNLCMRLLEMHIVDAGGDHRASGGEVIRRITCAE